MCSFRTTVIECCDLPGNGTICSGNLLLRFGGDCCINLWVSPRKVVLDYHEDGGSKFFQNISNKLPTSTLLYPRRV